MLVEMIDRTLDDYKEELMQILFPIFTILFVTQVRRGFESSARQFFDKYCTLFRPKNTSNSTPSVLDDLERVKTSNDLSSSLEVNKYIKNKFHLKLC